MAMRTRMFHGILFHFWIMALLVILSKASAICVSKNPCANGGVCTHTSQGYSCTCTAGYTGRNCESAINPCRSTPCRHGVCRANGFNYQCLCKKGYTGVNCDQDIDECDLKISNCASKCTNTFGSYRCSCHKDYVLLPDGQTCIDPCISYINVKDESRRVQNLVRTSYCDRELLEQNSSKWYRFNGGKFSQMMPTTPVGMFHCGASSPGWLATAHPTVRQGIINGTVCFSSHSDSCRWRKTIHIKNCGGHYIYQLPPPPTCFLRYCSDQYDYCKPNPCLHGTCRRTSNGFSCDCRPGFEGKLCQQDTNDCGHNKGGCQGTCHSIAHGYRCSCPSGQELDSDNHTCNDPCAASGTRFKDSLTTEVDAYRLSKMKKLCRYSAQSSQNLIKWYQSSQHPRCTTIARWINVTQYTNSSFKIGRLCFHFGLSHCSFEVVTKIRGCSNTISYKLDPLSACFLDYCSKIETDHCFGHKCMHGRCIANQNGYICDCNKGYSGEFCQFDIDHCNNNKCKNGVCVANKNSYMCNCTEGYYGEYCQYEYHCKWNPCLNGKCIEQGTDYRCDCKSGYYGRNCSQEYCNPNPCANGQCQLRAEGYHCHCKEGFHGKYCQSYRGCQSNPCQNGGQCQFSGSGYQCNCRSGYYGENCQNQTCKANSCRNNGKCEPLQGAQYRCSCRFGYYGKFCENEVCQMNTCKNGGNCQPTYGKNYRCICSRGFYGTHCENKVCQTTSCKNGGNCEPTYGSNYRCSCRRGFYGTHCENRVCRSNSCKNDGVCEPTYGHNYRCRCKPGFLGQYCEHGVCDSNPCKNSGKCQHTSGNHYKCSCQHERGYYGRHCEKHACQPNRCQNNGICSVSHVRGNTIHYRCSCQSGFYGGHCEGSVCQPDSCYNGATCYALGRDAECRCRQGYFGARCQYAWPQCSCWNMPCLWNKLMAGQCPKLFHL